MDLNKIQNLKNQALSSIIEADTKDELEQIRISYLGRKGGITNLLKEVPKLKPEERKEIGKLINEAKKVVEDGIKQQIKIILKQKENKDDKWFDVTMPGEKTDLGHLHLITLASQEISDIFKRIGFKQVSYPEIEWDWYAFEKLNMPKNHPARDEWETFFIKGLKTKNTEGQF